MTTPPLGWRDPLTRLAKAPLFAWMLCAGLPLGLLAIHQAWVLRATDGHFSGMIDDVYIHFQYAHEIAHGRFFEYWPGSGVTKGETSFLYPILLVPGFWLGFGGGPTGGGDMMIWALALALIGQVVMNRRLLDIALHLGLPSAGVFAVFGLGFTMHAQACFVSGMEVSLMAGLLATWAWLALRVLGGDTERMRTLAIVCFLLPMLRPEGLPAAAMGALILLVRARARLRVGVPLAALALSGQLLFSGFYAWHTGSPSPNSATAKSHLSDPNLDFDEAKRAIVTNAYDTFARVLTGDLVWKETLTLREVADTVGPPLVRRGVVAAETMERWRGRLDPRVLGYFPFGFLPWALLGAVLCGVWAWFMGRRGVGLWLLAGGAVWAAGLFVPQLTFSVWWGLYRYCVPFYPLLFLFAGIPIAWLLTATAQAWRGFGAVRLGVPVRAVLRGGILLVGLGVALVPTVFICGTLAYSGQGQLPGMATHWKREFVSGSRNIHMQQATMGRYIDAHLPADAIVAVNDAGAIPYFGRRRTLDIVGLVTNDLALCYRQGAPCLYDTFKTLPPERRPTHFAVYSHWMPLLDFVGRHVHGVTAPDAVMLGGIRKDLYLADFSRVPSVDRPVAYPLDAAARLLDEIDVMSVWHEKRSHYKILNSEGEAASRHRLVVNTFPLVGDPSRRVKEGGRVIPDGWSEVFTVYAEPGKDLYWVMRTDAYFGLRAEVSVVDDGTGRGDAFHGRVPLLWESSATPGRFGEPMILIPAKRIAGSRVRLRIRCVGRADYASWHHWFFADPPPTADEGTPTIPRPTNPLPHPRFPFPSAPPGAPVHRP